MITRHPLDKRGMMFLSYRYNLGTKFVEFFDSGLLIWRISINQNPRIFNTVSYEDTWCEPYEGMED